MCYYIFDLFQQRFNVKDLKRFEFNIKEDKKAI